jgi:hypothetical protein
MCVSAATPHLRHARRLAPLRFLVGRLPLLRTPRLVSAPRLLLCSSGGH